MAKIKYDYDIIILGGGSGGLVSSKLAVGLGKKVLLIEKNRLGGECSYSGCIPSKAFIRASKAFYDTNKLQQFGIKGSCKLDASNVMSYVKSVVNRVAKEHEPKVFEAFGIKIKFGSPEFIDNHTIKLSGKNITAKKFIITTGSSPLIPTIEGLDKVKYFTNDTFFEQKKLPASFIVLGGGPIGIELTQVLNRLGVRVTLVDMNERILIKDDKELTLILQEKLIKEGIKLLLETKAIKAEKNNTKITVTLDDEKKTKISGDALLVAAGRKPNTDGLHLENAGVTYNNRAIVVDEILRTTAANIYACGDVVGPFQFSHMAEYQAVIAVTNACLPITKKVDYSNVLWITFSDPEFAHAGVTEEQARYKYGKKIKVYKYGYNWLDRAITDSTEEGIAKFIIDKKGYLLGAHILGNNAGDIIHEAQILKSMKMKFTDIQNIIHAYPSYADITRQTGKKVYIDRLQNNPVIKFLKLFKRNK